MLSTKLEAEQWNQKAWNDMKFKKFEWEIKSNILTDAPEIYASIQRGRIIFKDDLNLRWKVLSGLEIYN